MPTKPSNAALDLATLPEWMRTAIRFSALSLIEWDYDSTRYKEYRKCDVCRCSKELNNRGWIDHDGITELGHDVLDAYALMDNRPRAEMPQRGNAHDILE